MPLSKEWIRQRANPPPPPPIDAAGRWNKWCPHNPTERQQEFLDADDVLDLFYGGQAGGGKSDAAIMGFLKYAHVPGYAGIILRRTFADLDLPGAVMDRAREWFTGMEGVRGYDGGKRWVFQCPDGGTSTLAFGYLEHEADKYRYQGAEFQYVSIDEAPQLTQTQQQYMFSRLRKPTYGPLSKVPLRFRPTGNPGGVSHDYIKERYIDDETREPGAVFIRATLEDNPHLDDSYLESLDKLDPYTRSQLKDGNWDAIAPGDFFDRSWFPIIEEEPKRLRAKVRFWDMAASEEPKKGEAKKDPDYTASCKMAMDEQGSFYILHVTNDRVAAAGTIQHTRSWADNDGRDTRVRMELEPGSSGLIVLEAFRKALSGYDFEGVRATGSKIERAKPASAAASDRKIFLVRGDWNAEFLTQLHRFPGAGKRDIVDATSGAFNELHGSLKGVAKVSTPEQESRPTVVKRPKIAF